MNIELAAESVRDGLRGASIQQKDDFDLIVRRAKLAREMDRLTEAYMAQFIPVFFDRNMESKEMADAAMKCRMAAKMMIHAARFKDDNDGN